MATAEVTQRLRSALGDATAGVAELAARARSWDAGQRRSVLCEVDRAIATLTAVRSELLLAERDSGDWRGSGDPTFAAWRGRTARVGVRGGVADERRAETLTAMPDVRTATVAGAVSVAHVDVIGQTTARGSQAVRDALGSPDGQAQVLTLARRLDAGRFATALAKLAAGVDADHVERTHQAQRAERYLHLAQTPSGTRLSGQLDAMAGHRLRLALEALSPRPAADDDRSAGQRSADALEALAETVLSLPATGLRRCRPTARVVPHDGGDVGGPACRPFHGRARPPRKSRGVDHAGHGDTHGRARRARHARGRDAGAHERGRARLVRLRAHAHRARRAERAG